jgi:hypothetical protein
MRSKSSTILASQILTDGILQVAACGFQSASFYFFQRLKNDL